MKLEILLDLYLRLQVNVLDRERNGRAKIMKLPSSFSLYEFPSARSYFPNLDSIVPE
jgi:hypothetical protein